MAQVGFSLKEELKSFRIACSNKHLKRLDKGVSILGSLVFGFLIAFISVFSAIIFQPSFFWKVTLINLFLIISLSYVFGIIQEKYENFFSKKTKRKVC